jgi:hypothetical protein
MEDANISTGDPLADKVKIDLDMLRALVLDGVGGEVDGADVVAENEGAPGQRTVELLEQLTKPGRLSHVVRHTRGTRPRHWSGIQPAGASMTRRRDCPRGTRHNPRWTCACLDSPPSRHRVDAKLHGRVPAEKEPEVDGATQVPQDALHRGEMRLPRVMHVEAHLLDGVGDVRPSEDEVLQGPNKASVASRIGDRGARSGDLALRVHWGRAGLALSHASALEEVDSVLLLVKEHALGPVLDGDPLEVVEGPEVLHRKLLLEAGDDATQKPRGGGGEHDVVDVEEEVRNIRTAMEDEQGRVRLGLDKTL